MVKHKRWTTGSMILSLGLGMSACGSETKEPGTDGEDDGDAPIAVPTQLQLEQRAYIVSRDSEELTVIDLAKLEIIRKVQTGGAGNHMAELTGDFKQVLVTSSATDEAILVDTTKLEVTGSITVTGHPTHIARTPDDRRFALMVEDTNEVAFVDGQEGTVAERLGGFSTPHFMRFTPDGNFGYVANIGGNRITRVDMQNMKVLSEISLDAYADRREIDEEGGFADAQISSDGIVYAAHNSSGKVLAIDAQTGVKISEIEVGAHPWVAFAEHPFKDVKLRHVVPNFGDKTVSIIAGENREPSVMATLEGDEEAYGVNFSSLEPNLAFVMNRVREDIAVVDTERGEIVERIDVGGNTETASTTPDGKLIVATVSNRNRVVVIDVATRKIKKTFDDVGVYPWSVTIPKGQNYCH
ncbi:MAG: hypothetical protein ABW321_06210 [Polyangiales bacterium]